MKLFIKKLNTYKRAAVVKQLLFAFHNVIIFENRLAKIVAINYLCRKLFIMLKTRDSWDRLSMFEKADLIKYAVQNGIYNPSVIRQAYNEFAEGGEIPPYSVGNLVNSIYERNPVEKFMGEPEHHYDFAQSEEWANAHGYYPDARGHRDDRVKKPAHPSHPSRGVWKGKEVFDFTDVGMSNPNYTLFGLVDNNQDPQAVLTYRGGIVLPEMTVTPEGNYISNPYDNIRLYMPNNSYPDGGEMTRVRRANLVQ